MLGAYFAVFGFALPGWNRTDPNELEGLFWPQQKQLEEFSLTDHTGVPFDLEALQDGWHLVFFGYTYCPDICPITMATLRETSRYYLEMVESDLRDLTMTFVSVDGERDTTEHLANYIGFYDKSFKAAGGDKTAVDSLTVQLGVPYEIEEHEPGDQNYLVSHTGALFLLSPEGKLAALFNPPHSSKALAENLARIREFIAAES